MNLPLQAVMQTFCIEARERIAELEAGLLTLEQAPSDTEALSAVFRAAHTIKGSAGMLGLDQPMAGRDRGSEAGLLCQSHLAVADGRRITIRISQVARLPA